MLDLLLKETERLANPEKARLLQRYFKTGKGEYGEGDIFLGITVPIIRGLVRKYKSLEQKEIENLLNSRIHEHRMLALLMMVEQFRKADSAECERLVNFYLSHTDKINNWDLVDLSAPKIVGEFLFQFQDRGVLYKLVKSRNLWERRIAVLSCFKFIQMGQFDDALKIAEILREDKHDLIQKAVGWMLREIGKRDKKAEVKFLEKYHKTLPRTLLRYAIEKFSEKERKYFLGKLTSV
jgi:3-methyladenine DNA glycosylase AlkD